MEETLISPSQSTSEIGFSPFSIDKLELKLPFRVSDPPATTITRPMSTGLRRVCRGRDLRISPHGDVSLVKDCWITNGHKFVCQYLGVSYAKKSKTSNFYEQSDLTDLALHVDKNTIRENLIPFIVGRIQLLFSENLQDLPLCWHPTAIRNIEVCKDHHLLLPFEDLRNLLCQAASSIEGEPIEVGEVRATSTVPFHFKWTARCVSLPLKGKGIIRTLKVYPKPNGIRMELQIRKLKFKPWVSEQSPVDELCNQLSKVADAMVDYLMRIENEIKILSPRLNEHDLSDFREAVNLYLDVGTERGKIFVTSITGPSGTYTNGRHQPPIRPTEFKRLSDHELGICSIKFGQPGFPNSLVRRHDWRTQVVKKKMSAEQLSRRRSEIQIQSRKRKESQQTSVWDQSISRRQFISGTFLRRLLG
ncbi:MAG: hypothetical protein KF681_15835 [Bdellovibrionaceae bacterium]|nr:hypothetical protein [Pseudobdellovibrionaceae bacterium]